MNSDGFSFHRVKYHLPLLPVPPHVGHDVGVEVGVAEVQGEGEEDEEAPEGGEAARPVLRDEGRGVGHMLGRTVQHGEHTVDINTVSRHKIGTLVRKSMGGFKDLYYPNRPFIKIIAYSIPIKEKAIVEALSGHCEIFANLRLQL